MKVEDIKREILANQAILIDVREQDEWDAGHLKHARLIPLSELTEGNIPDDLPLDKTIFLHCRRGGRAVHAEQILKEIYPNVKAVKLSYDDLKQGNL